MILDDYKLIEKIAASFFVTIWKATKEGSNDFYSVYKMKKNHDNNSEVNKVLKEGREVLKDINHPNILKLLDIKEDPEYFYFIYEYCNGGTLNNFLNNYIKETDQPLSEEIVQYIMKQLVDVIKYLHDKKIVHRDIKPYEILIKYNSEEDLLNKNILKSKIILTGFDVSAHLIKGDSLYTFVGTMHYISPEIKEGKPYNEKVDIWNLGINCYQLLYGEHPHIPHKEYKIDYDSLKSLSKEAKSFIECMLQEDPKKRISADELKKHEFLIKNFKDFIQEE